MYYLLQLFLVGWSIYLEVTHKLSEYQLIMVILVSMIVELLVALNRKFDTADIEIVEEEEKK